MTTRLRLLVAGPDRLTRVAVTTAIERRGDIEVVGEAADDRSALEQVQTIRPAIVILDATLPLDAFETCATIKASLGGVRVLILDEHVGDETALLAAVEAGADGYLSGDAGLDTLASALDRLVRGEAVVPPSMLGSLLRQLIEKRREGTRALELFMTLTPREKEVLGLLAAGSDQNDIARILVISPETARTHIQNVIRKLDVRSRLEAATLAVEHGLVERLEATEARS